MAKESKKPAVAVDMPEMSKMPKRATIEEAANGYIVSGYDAKGNHNQSVHESMEGVHSMMDKMMGNKKMMEDDDEMMDDKKENFSKTKEKAMKKMMKK